MVHYYSQINFGWKSVERMHMSGQCRRWCRNTRNVTHACQYIQQICCFYTNYSLRSDICHIKHIFLQQINVKILNNANKKSMAVLTIDMFQEKVHICMSVMAHYKTCCSKILKAVYVRYGQPITKYVKNKTQAPLIND